MERRGKREQERREQEIWKVTEEGQKRREEDRTAAEIQSTTKEKEEQTNRKIKESEQEENEQEGGSVECPRCKRNVAKGVLCSTCKNWWHYRCDKTTKEEVLINYCKKDYQCRRCRKGETENNEIEGQDTRGKGELSQKEKHVNNEKGMSGKTAEEKKQNGEEITEDNIDPVVEKIVELERQHIELQNITKEKTLEIENLKDRLNYLADENQKLKNKEKQQRDDEIDETRDMEGIKEILRLEQDRREDVEQKLTQKEKEYRSKTEEYSKERKRKEKELKELKVETVRYKEGYEEVYGELNEVKRQNKHLCNSLEEIKKINEDLICKNEELKIDQRKTEGNRKDKNEEKQEKSRKQMCRYDQQGKCRKGENCNYRHKEQNIEKEQIEWCRYDKNGVCRRRETCKYKHKERMDRNHQKKREDTCRYFERDGNCKYGWTCRYKHEQNRNRENIGRSEKDSENRETNIREKINFLEEKIVDILDQVKQIRVEQHQEQKQATNAMQQQYSGYHQYQPNNQVQYQYM